MNLIDAERVLAAVAEEVEAAACGISTWSNVGLRLSEGFPGSACVILNEDQSQQVLRHYDAINIENHYMHAYAEYFAFRNPWIEVWSHLPEGSCAVSERDFPVSQIEHTEYYNDFLRLIPNFDASTGLSLDIDPVNTFRIPLHYSIAYAGRYDCPAEWVLSRLRGVLRRTANGFDRLQSEADRQIAQGALANRGDTIAIVVDAKMKLLDANPEALNAFVRRDFVMEQYGRIAFQPRKLGEMIAATVKSIASSPTSGVSSLISPGDHGKWVISFSIVAGSRINPFVSPRPLVLIQAKNISSLAPAQPLLEFAQLFKLTPAEEVFCRHLITGVSLKDIAIVTGVSFETARVRLKSIFQKTDTHRQGELVALLHRFARP